MARLPGKSKFKEGKDVQFSLQKMGLGVTEYTLTPSMSDGKVARIRLKARTAEAKQALEKGSLQDQLEASCKSVIDMELKTNDTLDLRFIEKAKPGRKPKAQPPVKAPKKTVKKLSGRKKRTSSKIARVKPARKPKPPAENPTQMNYVHQRNSKAKIGGYAQIASYAWENMSDDEKDAFMEKLVVETHKNNGKYYLIRTTDFLGSEVQAFLANFVVRKKKK